MTGEVSAKNVESLHNGKYSFNSSRQLLGTGSGISERFLHRVPSHPTTHQNPMNASWTWAAVTAC